MPLLQLALDTTDLGLAADVAQGAKDHVDVIEAGTLLCATCGMEAVRKLKKVVPEKEVLADLRIVRAGKALAEVAFGAGADIVTCVAEAPRETLEGSVAQANNARGRIELELSCDWNLDDLDLWRKLGIKDVICHNGAEVSSMDGKDWGEHACAKVRQVAGAGLNVTVAGGVTLENAAVFRDLPVSKVVCGKSIWNVADPAGAARKMAEALAS